MPPQAMADVRYGIPLVGSTEIDVLANDFDPNGDPLTITSITTPSNGTAAITGSGKKITFTPGAGFSSTSLQYTINDGHGHTTSALIDMPYLHAVRAVDPEGLILLGAASVCRTAAALR